MSSNETKVDITCEALATYNAQIKDQCVGLSSIQQ